MKNNNLFKYDFYRIFGRYPSLTDMFRIYKEHTLKFLYLFRLEQHYENHRILRLPYKVVKERMRRKYGIEIGSKTKIGKGFCMVHGFNITINGMSTLGKNVTIYKGATIGYEYGFKNRGTPTIGNNVFIGINSTIVGKISIGSNVLIAPNAHVNINIPDNSIVLGNPCRVISKQDATESYIKYKV